MPFSAGIATLAQVKRRLSIADAVDDALLQDIINGVSGAMEAYCGRRLRRDHRRTEYFRGGSEVIRVQVYPIAKIHSIRESSTRDFSDSGAYVELVEGEDYVLESSEQGEQPGYSGLIRRIGRWLGSDGMPGTIQVVYTGGYKTADEEALENQTVVISASDEVSDYGILQTSVTDLAGTTTSYQLINETDTEIPLVVGLTPRKSTLRFSSPSILPVWAMYNMTLAFRMRATAFGSITPTIRCIADDPRLRGSLSTIYAATGAEIVTPPTLSSNALAAYSVNLHGLSNYSAILSLLNSTMAVGHISFLFGRSDAAQTETLYIAASEDATPANRPTLSISHGLAFLDPYSIDSDLVSACAVQSVHDYQTRKQPGMRNQANRGVAIASGSSYMKDPAELLPYVKSVVDRYARAV